MRLLLLLGLALAAAPVAAAAQATATLRDWWAACDEQRTCWAFGFSEDGADAMAFIRIERSGSGGAEPAVVLAAGQWEGEASAPSATLRVSIDGVARPALKAHLEEDRRYLETWAVPAGRSTVRQHEIHAANLERHGR